MLGTWENMSSMEPGLHVVHQEEQTSVEENGQECFRALKKCEEEGLSETAKSSMSLGRKVGTSQETHGNGGGGAARERIRDGGRAAEQIDVTAVL